MVEADNDEDALAVLAEPSSFARDSPMALAVSVDPRGQQPLDNHWYKFKVLGMWGNGLASAGCNSL